MKFKSLTPISAPFRAAVTMNDLTKGLSAFTKSCRLWREGAGNHPLAIGLLMGAMIGVPTGVGLCQDKTPPQPARVPAQEVVGSIANPPDEAELNVRNAEIATLIRIFSKRTKRNYLLDDRVKGKVTLYLPGKLSPEESIKILDSILALKGFTTIPVGENLWKIIPSKEARQATVPLLAGAESPGKAAAVVSRVFPLVHVGAEEVQPLVTQLISPDGFVSALGGGNSLLVIDYEDNSDRLKQLIETIDVPMAERDMTIIPIKNADAKDIGEKLRELLGLGQSGASGAGAGSGGAQSGARSQPVQLSRPIGSPAGSPPGGGGDGQVMGVSVSGAPRTTPPQLIADERTNSIIVVADDTTTARIKALVSELDSKVDLSGNRFYIYRCQHAKAEDLANVLSGLAGGGGGNVGAGGTGAQRTAAGGLGNTGGGFGMGGGAGMGGLGMQNQGMGMMGGSSMAGRGRSGLGMMQGGGGFGGGTAAPRQVASVRLNETTSITADPSTNTLIIQSNRSDYEKIRSLIDSLDVKRRQVLVEAMLLEVSVDNTQTTGIDFLTSTGGADGGVVAQSQLGGAQGLQGLLSSPGTLSGFSIAAASRGSLKISDKLTIPTQAVMLSAAKSNQNVNVLSAPTLLATDNEPAEIVVGQNVPFLASTSTNQTNLSNTFNQIDRQDVGITLRITPQISSEDFVTLNIFTNVSDLVPTASTALGPTTTVRSSQTTVITKDGQMIVIGGLMADQNNDSDTGVPFLKDIPILGSAFRRNTERRVRTNLLTFITPHVVKDQFDARDQTLGQRDKVRDVIDEFGSRPNRSELLDSPALDNVPEIERGEFVAPGTIKGPRSDELPTQASQDGSAREAAAGSRVGLPSGLSPREVRVAPRVPAASLSREDGDRQVGESPMAAHGASFIVMQLIKGKPGKQSLLREKQGVVAVQLPEGTPQSARDFFAPGKRIIFDDPSGPITLEVRERHPTAESGATGRNLRPDDWRIISPFELLRLGQGPWRMAESGR